jgi:hypothetical protein
MAVNVTCHSFINVNTHPLTHLSGTKPAHCSFLSTVPEAYTLPFLRSVLPCAIRGLLCCLYFVAIAVGSSNVSTRSRWPMPRYYFHFRCGSSIFEDDLGEEFADAAAALQQAKRIALELARAGESTNSVVIVVEGDRQLFEVPLSENGS